MLSYNNVHSFESEALPQLQGIPRRRTCNGTGSSVRKEILKLLQTSFPHRSYWLVSAAMHFLTKFTSFTTISPFKKRKRALCELLLHYKMSTVSVWPRSAAWRQWEGTLTPTRTMGIFIPTEVTVTTGAPFLTHGNEAQRARWSETVQVESLHSPLCCTASL